MISLFLTDGIDFASGFVIGGLLSFFRLFTDVDKYLLKVVRTKDDIILIPYKYLFPNTTQVTIVLKKEDDKNNYEWINMCWFINIS